MNGRKLIPGNPLLEPDPPDYAIRRDTLDEVFSHVFLRRLRRINAIVTGSGEPLEGNIFYPEGDPYADRPPAADLAPARRNVWRAVRFKERLLEVGVNAGHGALLALSSNPTLQYYGVDVMDHAYTADCVDFLKREFPGRVHLFPGDSRDVLPRLADQRRDELAFDIMHVDGGHTSEICLADMSNCVRLASGKRGRHLLLDDVHASWIFDIYCAFVARGALTTETFFGDWEDAGRNVLARIE